MKLELLKKYLFTKQFSREDYPFGPEPMVAKVFNKMFALVSFGELPLKISLKCAPNDAQILRTMHKSIKPGYHLNKCYVPHNNSLCLIDKEVLNYYRQLLNKQGGKQ